MNFGRYSDRIWTKNNRKKAGKVFGRGTRARQTHDVSKATVQKRLFAGFVRKVFRRKVG